MALYQYHNEKQYTDYFKKANSSCQERAKAAVGVGIANNNYRETLQNLISSKAGSLLGDKLDAMLEGDQKALKSDQMTKAKDALERSRNKLARLPDEIQNDATPEGIRARLFNELTTDDYVNEYLRNADGINPAAATDAQKQVAKDKIVNEAIGYMQAYHAALTEAQRNLHQQEINERARLEALVEKNGQDTWVKLCKSSKALVVIDRGIPEFKPGTYWLGNFLERTKFEVLPPNSKGQTSIKFDPLSKVARNHLLDMFWAKGGTPGDEPINIKLSRKATATSHEKTPADDRKLEAAGIEMIVKAASGGIEDSSAFASSFGKSVITKLGFKDPGICRIPKPPSAQQILEQWKNAPRDPAHPERRQVPEEIAKALKNFNPAKKPMRVNVEDLSLSLEENERVNEWSETWNALFRVVSERNREHGVYPEQPLVNRSAAAPAPAAAPAAPAAGPGPGGP